MRSAKTLLSSTVIGNSSQVIGCYMRHIWKSTDLHKRFSSSLEVLDEMRSVRCIEHTHRARFITPFVGDQLAICNAFGFDVPVGLFA